MENYHILAKKFYRSAKSTLSLRTKRSSQRKHHGTKAREKEQEKRKKEKTLTRMWGHLERREREIIWRHICHLRE